MSIQLETEKIHLQQALDQVTSAKALVEVALSDVTAQVDTLTAAVATLQASTVVAPVVAP